MDWKRAENEIVKLLLKHNKTTLEITDNYLDSFIQDDKETCLRVKQLQMKMGKIWEILIGSKSGNKNLKEGFDIYQKSTNTWMEIKNCWNTNNSKSKRAIYDNMVAKMREDKTAKCILGIINAKKKEGSHSIVKREGFQIHIYSGECFLDFIFGSDRKKVEKFVCDLLRKYLNNLK